MSGATNCPETPRQKMIGIMYLVLTAMLALNVSASILNGYLQVDDSLHAAIETTEESNAALYARFQVALEKNPGKTQDWYDKAQQVKDSSAVFYAYVQNFKNQMVFMSEGDTTRVNVKVADLSRKDDTNIPHYYALELGNATELKEMIKGYRDFLIDITGKTPVLDTELNKIFSTDSIDDGSGMKSWEHTVFQDMPMCASITILTKLQNDIRHYEGKAVETLMSATDAGDLRVNKFNAYVIPSANYVVKGTKYTAQVILAAIDSTQTPEYYVNGQKLDNKGIYEVIANTVGVQKISGKIGYMDQQGVMQYLPFEREYTVGEPTATISNTDLNIMYRGYDNPFSISVPGVSAHLLQVKCAHATVRSVGNAQWHIVPEANSPDNVTIQVYANLEGTNIMMGEQEYRVKPVPKPNVYFEINGELTDDFTIPYARLRNRNTKLVSSYGADGLIKAKFEIVRFTVGLPSGRVVRVTGNKFDNRALEEIGRLSKGSMVTIYDIYAQGQDKNELPLRPIIITL